MFLHEIKPFLSNIFFFIYDLQIVKKTSGVEVMSETPNNFHLLPGLVI